MAEQRLLDYIKGTLGQGFHIDAIRLHLLKTGWHENDVDNAIKVTYRERHGPGERAMVPFTGEVCESLGVLSKLRLIVRSNSRFFGAVDREFGYECPVKFYLFLLLIQAVMVNALIFLMPAGLLAGAEGSLINPLLGLLIIQSLTDLILVNISVAISVLMTILVASFIHLFVRLMKGSGGPLGTFKAIVYSYTPNVILTMLAAASVALSLALSVAYPSLGLVSCIYMIIPVMSLPFLAWSLYLQVKGLSVFHRISGIRALSAVVLSGAALLAVVWASTLGTMLVTVPALV
jgi:hypothetical protein